MTTLIFALLSTVWGADSFTVLCRKHYQLEKKDALAKYKTELGWEAEKIKRANVERRELRSTYQQVIAIHARLLHEDLFKKLSKADIELVKKDLQGPEREKTLAKLKKLSFVESKGPGQLLDSACFEKGVTAKKNEKGQWRCGLYSDPKYVTELAIDSGGGQEVCSVITTERGPRNIKFCSRLSVEQVLILHDPLPLSVLEDAVTTLKAEDYLAKISIPECDGVVLEEINDRPRSQDKPGRPAAGAASGPSTQKK